MANLRDNFADKEKNLSHLTPSAKPAPPHQPIGGLTPVVYHGTPHNFGSFSDKGMKAVQDTSDPNLSGQPYQNAFFFTDKPEYANNFIPGSGERGQIKMARLALQNPHRVHHDDPGLVSDHVAEAKKRGHDGLIFSGDPNRASEYVAFDPSQIRSPHARSIDDTSPRLTPAPAPESPAHDDTQASGPSLPSIGGRERPGSQDHTLGSRNASSPAHRDSADHHHLPKAANQGKLRGGIRKQLARRGIMAGCLAVATEGIVVLLVVVVLFAAAMSFTGEDAQAGTCDVGGGVSVGAPNESGIVQLPESSDYAIQNPGQRNEQWGKPEMVQTILQVARQWNAKHPDSKLSIGDLGFGTGPPYAAYKAYNPDTLHASHKLGVDVDLTHPQATVAGNSALSTELGKLFIDVGNVDMIFFNDAETQNAVNRYREERGLPGRMLPEEGHATHFHVRINPGPIGGGAGSDEDCVDASSGVKYNKQYTLAELRRIFGPPSREAPDRLTSIDFLGTSVQVHKLVAPSLEAVAAEIESSGVTYRPEARKQGIGCFRATDAGQIGDRSYHVYGAACDINPYTNPNVSRSLPYNPTCGLGGITHNTCYDMPPEYVRIFAKYGFTWGGKWKSEKDYMHFEWHGVKP